MRLFGDKGPRRQEEKLLLREIAKVNQQIFKIEWEKVRSSSSTVPQSGALAAARELSRVEDEIRVLELRKRLQTLEAELRRKIADRQQYADNLRQQLQQGQQTQTT